MASTEEKLQSLAGLYAVLVMLLGLGILGATAFLVFVFGPHGAMNSRYLLFVIVPAIAAIALARQVKRQNIWAMLAALALAVFARFAYAGGLMVDVALTVLALAFAAITAFHLWHRMRGGNRAPG